MNRSRPNAAKEYIEEEPLIGSVKVAVDVAGDRRSWRLRHDIRDFQIHISTQCRVRVEANFFRHPHTYLRTHPHCLEFGYLSSSGMR